MRRVTLALLALALGGRGAFADDAAFQFGTTANPAGNWSYGWASAPGSVFQPFTTKSTTPNGVTTWNTVNGAALGLTCAGAYDPGRTWLYGHLTARVGSGGAATVLRWTAPTTGNWHVRGSFLSEDGYFSPPPGTLSINGAQASAQFGQAIAVGDVNGDGFADVLVGQPNWSNGQINEGRVALYLGGPFGWNTTPVWTDESNVAGALEGASVAIGDFDGDGYGDVAVGRPQELGGYVFLYRGGPSGIPTFASVVGVPSGSNRFGQAIVLADFNRDGKADLVVGEPVPRDIIVYPGNASATLTGGSGFISPAASFGSSLANAGDVNGDGYPDLLVGAPDYNSGQGAVFLFLGYSLGVSTPYWWTRTGTLGTSRLGAAVCAAGDLDHDGFADFLVSEPGPTTGGTGHVYLFRGAVDSPVSPPAVNLAGQSSAHFGAALAFVGDANRDGYPDFVVGSPTYANGQSGEGLAQLYLGGPGATVTAGWSLESNQVNANLGQALAAGDVNGDGMNDIVVGSPLYDGPATDGGRTTLVMNAVTPPVAQNKVDLRLIVGGVTIARDSIVTVSAHDTITMSADVALSAGQTIDVEVTDLDPQTARDLTSLDVAIEPTTTPAGPQGPVFPLAGQRFVPVLGPKGFEALAYDPLAKKFASNGSLYDRCGNRLSNGPDGPGIAWDPVTRKFWNIFYDAGNVRWVVASWDTTAEALTQVFLIPRVLSVPGTGADTLEDARGIAVDSSAVYVVDAGPTNLVPPANAWFKFSRTGTPLASLKGAGFAINSLADIVDDVVYAPFASPTAPGRLLVAVEHTGIVVLGTNGAQVDTFTWRSQGVPIGERPNAFAGLALDPGNGDLYLADNDRSQAEHWIRLSDPGPTGYLIGDGNPMMIEYPVAADCGQPTMWDSLPPRTTCPQSPFIFGVAYRGADQRVYAIDYGDGTLWKFDPRSGRGSRAGVTNLSSVWGLAYDPGRDRLYGAQQLGGANQLWSIDPRTGVPTAFPQATPYAFDDIAFEPNGAYIYTVTSTGGPGKRLLRIDRTTGAATVIGPTAGDVRGLDYDPIRGALLGVGASDSLWSINVGTGAASLLSVIPSSPGWEGLAVVPVPAAGSVDVGHEPSHVGPLIALAAYPIPFGERTRLTFALGGATRVRLEVFDVCGRLVRRLSDGPFAAGPHAIEWDGGDAAGSPVAAGVYFARLTQGSRSVTTRLVRLR